MAWYDSGRLKWFDSHTSTVLSKPSRMMNTHSRAVRHLSFSTSDRSSERVNSSGIMYFICRITPPKPYFRAT